jgi:hypothetical protein
VPLRSVVVMLMCMLKMDVDSWLGDARCKNELWCTVVRDGIMMGRSNELVSSCCMVLLSVL